MSPRLYRCQLEALDAKLSERERAALSVLLEMRFLSTRQLERWIFDGVTPLARARAARRSIAKLAHLGIIRHLERRIGGVRAGSAGYINVLTPLGLRLAAVYGWITPEQTRRTREPGGQFVGHYLAVAEAHLRVVEAQEQGTIELLERQAEPDCWRSFTGPNGLRTILKPDGFFAIGSGEWTTHWFLEVDRSTASGATLDRKLSAYVAYWRSGQEVAARGVHPRTLWQAPDARRVEQLQAAIDRLPVDTRPLFAVTVFDQVVEAMTQ